MNGDSTSPTRTSDQSKTSQIRYSTTKIKRKSSITGRFRGAGASSARFSTISKSGLESNTNLRSRIGVEQKKNDPLVIVRDVNGEDATPISLSFTKSVRIDTTVNQESNTKVYIY
jgi:hypothetical protein